MKLETDFNLGQRVCIIEIGLYGRISEIRFGYGGLSYNIEYWKELEPKSVVCRAEEINLEGTDKLVGIKPEVCQ